MSNKGRGPNKNELSLWDRFKRDINPLHPKKSAPMPTVSAPPQSIPPHKAVKNPVSIFLDQHHKDAMTKASSVAISPLDGNTMNKLRKGKFPIEGILDMHGMTQIQAHQALNGFVTRAFQAQKRCVLVITGKGTRSSAEGGILRSQLPVWLTIPPLDHMVLSHVSAKAKDGGQGAFYLYLKRPKI